MLTLKENVRADLYLARVDPPGLFDIPSETDLPVQQWPPYYAYNDFQFNVAVPPQCFLIERGLIETSSRLLRTNGLVSDYIVLDPNGLRVSLKVMEAHLRFQGGDKYLSIFYAKPVQGYPQ